MYSIKIVIDTLNTMSNDSLAVVKSLSNSNQSTSPEWAIPLIICVALVVLTGIIAFTLYLSVKNKHEFDLQSREKDRVKDERKNLLDFCYKLAEKKSSATKEDINNITKEYNKTIENGNIKEEKTTIKEVSTASEKVGEKNPPETITLDQIRQECWTIIKMMNNVKVDTGASSDSGKK